MKTKVIQLPQLQWGVLFTWVTLITVMSLLPSSNLNTSLFNIPHADKIVHFGFYFVFGFLLLRACSFLPSFLVNESWYVCFIIPMVYSGGIELLQEYLVESRGAEFLDLLANILGSVTGVLIYRRLFNKEFNLGEFIKFNRS